MLSNGRLLVAMAETSTLEQDETRVEKAKAEMAAFLQVHPYSKLKHRPLTLNQAVAVH